MSKKLRTLQKLRKKVQKYGVIDCEYIRERDGKDCYCAVGHLMNVCGVDMDTIKSCYNGDNIGSFDVSNAEKLIQPILDEGFHMLDLQRLQGVNDSHGDHVRKREVLTFIDEMIKEEEDNNGIQIVWGREML